MPPPFSIASSQSDYALNEDAEQPYLFLYWSVEQFSHVTSLSPGQEPIGCRRY